MKHLRAATLLLLALTPGALRAQSLWERAVEPGLGPAHAEVERADAARLGAYARNLTADQRSLILRRADEAYARALALQPDLVAALRGAAETREGLGQYALAERHAQRALELEPDGAAAPELWFTLALIHTRLGRFDAARDDYVRQLAFPLEARQRAITFGNLADTYVSLGDLARAITSYESCVAHHPDYAMGWLGLAVTYDRDGRDDLLVATHRALVTAATQEYNRTLYTALELGFALPVAHARAERARVATAVLGPNELGSPNVFFVPDHDRLYYEAVAHEAIARELDRDWNIPPDGRAHRAAALATWRRYAAACPPDDPWLPRVRAHIAALDPPGQPARPTIARRPRR